MSGLFGGLLNLIDPLGGYVLHVLIGPKAWKEGKGARMARLIFGGAFAGTVIGAFIGGICGLVFSISAPQPSLGLALGGMIVMAFSGAMLGLITLPFPVLFLEVLRTL